MRTEFPKCWCVYISTNPRFRTQNQNIVLNYVFPDGFDPKFMVDNPSFVVGISESRSQWDYSFSNWNNEGISVLLPSDQAAYIIKQMQEPSQAKVSGFAKFMSKIEKP